MPITPANHVKVIFSSRLPDGHASVNVAWYIANVSPEVDNGLAAAVALAGHLDTQIGVKLRALMGADGEYVGTQVTLNTGGVTFTAFNSDQAGVGAAGGDCLPNNCAALIQKRTAVAGRTGRGRWYIGGIAEAMQDNSRLVLAGQGLLSQLAEEFQAHQIVPDGTDYQPCHLSGSGELSPLIGCQPLVRIFSQRRRSFRNSF